MKHAEPLSKSAFATVVSTLMLLFILAGTYYIYYSRPFLDAGFYLNSCREVYLGNMPYRDFFFVQGPVYPYVYGTLLQLCGGPSLIAARFISIFFGLLTVAIAVWTAHRRGNQTAAIITLLALTTVPYQAYFFISIKLYALTAFFFTSAIALFASRLPIKIRHSLGLLLMVLAASTRLTLVPLAFIAAGYIIIDSMKLTRKIPWQALLAACVAATSLAGPFLLADAEAMLYNLIGIHTSAAAGPYLFSFTKQLKVLAKLVIFYPVLSIAGLFLLYQITSSRSLKHFQRLDWFILTCLGVITGVHLTANWFSMGYQSPVMPVTATIIAILTSRYLSSDHIPRVVVIPVLIAIATTWFLSWQKPVWSPEAPVTRSLAFTTEVIDRFIPEDGNLAGCSGIFALEADRTHALAFGGAPFTYSPDWSTSNCLRYGAMNNEMILEKLEHKAIDGVLLEPDSFAVGFPGFYPVEAHRQHEIFEALEHHYKKAANLRSLGSAELNLSLYIPIKESSKGDSSR